jgi:hypothetical protein
MRLESIMSAGAFAIVVLGGCKPHTPAAERDGRVLSAGATSGSFGANLCTTGRLDSADAVVAALDTVNKVLGFASQVYRFGRDTMGYTIVTIPIPTTHARDPMAVIKLDKKCRVTSLVLTDSA